MRIQEHRYAAGRGLDVYYAALIAGGRGGTPTYAEASKDYQRAMLSAHGGV